MSDLPLAIGADILHHLPPIRPELVVEDPVSDLHGEEHRQDVHGLPHGKFLVIMIVFTPTLHKVLSYFKWSRFEPPLLAPLPPSHVVLWSIPPALVITLALCLAPQNVSYQVVLEELLPHGVGQLGEGEQQ